MSSPCPTRRCPRCDCADSAPQCDHCKVCPHATSPGEPPQLTVPRSVIEEHEIRVPEPTYVVALYADDGQLTVGIRPDGQIETGPNYEPDAAAREFWDAVTRAAQSASPWIDTISEEQS